jgi:hypothetical protein
MRLNATEMEIVSRGKAGGMGKAVREVVLLLRSLK